MPPLDLVYFMRTIPEISEFLAPLELKITERFIPALLRRSVTAFEREILELTVRYEGLGIVNPAKTCKREYKFSRGVTKPLVKLICMLENDYHSFNEGAAIETIKCVWKEKDIMHKKHYDELHQKASYNLQRYLE
jgi:hypothetical protein